MSCSALPPFTTLSQREGGCVCEESERAAEKNQKKRGERGRASTEMYTDVHVYTNGEGLGQQFPGCGSECDYY